MFTGTSILTLVYFFIGWPYLQQRFILQSLGALEQDLVAGLHLAVPLGPGESHGGGQESHLLIHPVCYYGVLPRRNKKKLDRPLPRWILCKYNRNHDQKVQRFLFFTHIYWKYFDYINHVFSKQKFYEIINVGLALFWPCSECWHIWRSLLQGTSWCPPPSWSEKSLSIHWSN